MKRYTIQLRRYHGKSHHTSRDYEICGTVKRVVRAQQIGNFCPLFCRHGNQEYLVHSDAGDVSDPFRATPEYANSFFIDLDSPCGQKTK